MDNSEFLTESQTLAYAGIDRNILTRFCETGYIKTKMLANGQILYSKSEIERVFGKRREVLSNNSSKKEETQVSSQASTLKVGNSDVTYSSLNSANKEFSPSSLQDQCYNNIQSPASRLIKFPEAVKANLENDYQNVNNYNFLKQHDDGIRKDFQNISNNGSNSIQNNFSSNIEPITRDESPETRQSFSIRPNRIQPTKNLQTSEVKNDINTAETIQNKPTLSNESNNKFKNANIESGNSEHVKKLENEVENLKQEIVKLQSYARLQKKLLEVKEKEINELKQEKDWLKNRIESQEEKNNRDQLLILSETRVIHNLIASAQKASPIRAALEWFGFAKKNRTETIDMVKE